MPGQVKVKCSTNTILKINVKMEGIRKERKKERIHPISIILTPSVKFFLISSTRPFNEFFIASMAASIGSAVLAFWSANAEYKKTWYEILCL